MKVYIVSGRYGSEMEEPMIFFKREDAENNIKENIYDFIIDDYVDEMESDGIDVSNIDDVLQWGYDNEYCDSYNNDFPDTYTADDTWSEYMITEHNINLE